MGHQIIKQPDGRLAVFSSISDSWILCNASADELAEYYANRAAEDARRSSLRIIAHVLGDEPDRVYAQFAMSVEEADELARENGNKTLQEMLEEGDRDRAGAAQGQELGGEDVPLCPGN